MLQIHTPLAVISGHSRAVSYVRWLGSDSIVSASTDNHLKLWDIGTATQSSASCKPVMSYTGEVVRASPVYRVSLTTAPHKTAQESSCWHPLCTCLLLDQSPSSSAASRLCGQACATSAHSTQGRYHFVYRCVPFHHAPTVGPLPLWPQFIALQGWPFAVFKAVLLPLTPCSCVPCRSCQREEFRRAVCQRRRLHRLWFREECGVCIHQSAALSHDLPQL